MTETKLVTVDISSGQIEIECNVVTFGQLSAVLDAAEVIENQDGTMAERMRACLDLTKLVLADPASVDGLSVSDGLLAVVRAVSAVVNEEEDAPLVPRRPAATSSPSTDPSNTQPSPSNPL